MSWDTVSIVTGSILLTLVFDVVFTVIQGLQFFYIRHSYFSANGMDTPELHEHEYGAIVMGYFLTNLLPCLFLSLLFLNH